MQATHFVDSAGHKIAVHAIEGEGPAILWIPGHKSVMTGGSKSEPLLTFCRQKGYRFVGFDYAGWGQSGDTQQKWDVDTWTGNIVDVIDSLPNEKVILVGCSMGGYLMLLAQQARPEKVCGLFGVCPGFGDYVNKTGRREVAYKNITLPLDYISDPVPHHIITKPIIVDVPLYILGSATDEKVPAPTFHNMLRMVQSPQAEIHLTPDGDHYFKRPQDIELFLEKLDAFRQRCL
ncbi:MAG: alpha/beta fold hydrolase [Bdellovibrionales bacterium]